MSPRCVKCGYSADDEQWPSFLMTWDGEELSGDMPVREMMERGWIPTIDPREEDAAEQVLAALRRFFEGDPSIRIEPSP